MERIYISDYSHTPHSSICRFVDKDEDGERKAEKFSLIIVFFISFLSA